MFRQVVAYRWIADATDADKAAFREVFDGLRAIPEVTSLRFADDARYFDGNFDVVAVMDFPDFVAARRYVADERHQAYIRDFASRLIGERVVVQHDWGVGDLAGIHHVTLPVADVARSRDWYARAFGFIALDGADNDADDDREVTLVHPNAPIEVILRHDPPRARALAGFDALALTTATIEDLDAVVARLDAQGVQHGAPTPWGRGVFVDVPDPDGLAVRLTTLLP